MTQSSDRYLAEAVSQLARAWARRSPAERSAFAGQLAAMSAPLEQPEWADAALRTVRERAALCGAVSPWELVRGLTPEDATRALDLLAPEFDRVQTARGWKWTLRTAPRRDVLGTIAGNGQLPDRLAEAAAIPTDRAGELLRLLVEARLARRDDEHDQSASVPEESPATFVQALTWARPLGGFGDELAAAQRKAAVRSLREGYDVLTRTGVFGRAAQLAELRQFAEAPLESDHASAFPVPLLPLTGIGGAGKSTVLGAFVEPYLGRIEDGDASGPAVVVLDFDRVLFRPGAELELSFELTRQLGCAAPSAGKDLSDLRDQVLLEQRQSGSDRHVSNVRSDSTIREASGFERDAGELIRIHGLADRPILLVLDTFEEWQRERLYPAMRRTPGNAPEDRILNWIHRAHTTMGLRNLRVVVSGRADLRETADFLGDAIRRPVVIGDLDTESAHDLLRALGVADQHAGNLAERAGGNPLTLYVAARFYLRLSPDERRDFLAGDTTSADALTAETRNEVLYGRFLSHIGDDQVRKLAYPGLLLRRVTPELVRQVLAGPCGLGKPTERDAVQLTERLAAEAWLVREDQYGLYHRKEVRKPMLALMASDPKYAAVARQIHAAAVEWYESNGDGRDQLPRDRAQVEGLYHQLMLASGNEPVAPESNPDRERWLVLAQALGDAVDELPAKVAAQVHVVRGDQISDSDAKSLPGSVWETWIEQRGAALVDNGEPAAALELFDMGQGQAHVQPQWLAQACSDAAQWDRYWPAVRGLQVAWPADDFLSSDRYALLNALLSTQLRDLDDYRNTLSAYFRKLLEGTGATASGGAERLFSALLCALGIPAGRPGTQRRISKAVHAVYQRLEAPVRLGNEQGVSDRFPVDQLRRLLTWIEIPSDDPAFVVADVASFCRPDPRWMRNFAAFAGISEQDGLDSYLVRLHRGTRTGTPGLTTDQALGEWAIDYERALGRPEIRLPRSNVDEGAGLVHVLRGDNPELRPAIQLALAGAATGGAGMRELAEIAMRLVPVPAADLRPSALADGTGSDKRTLIQLVEYVDRSGVMRDFLAQARRAWPQAELLQRVADAFGIWDDANNRLLDALADRLRNEPDEPEQG